jgi:hypothetical protein
MSLRAASGQSVCNLQFESQTQAAPGIKTPILTGLAGKDGLVGPFFVSVASHYAVCPRQPLNLRIKFAQKGG